MSEFSLILAVSYTHLDVYKRQLILVLQKKQENPTIDMAKIQMKSERLTPFGGLFSSMEQFDSTLSADVYKRQI